MSERRVTVRGESMSPRLSNGAEIVYDDEQFLNVAPVRGDLVLVSYLGEMMVKQVVAVPGDELGYELVSGAIYRLKVNESVATNSAGSEYHFNDRQVGMLRLYGGVLDGCYCVMSDSMDGYGSHNFGCLEVEEFCYHWTARPDSDQVDFLKGDFGMDFPSGKARMEMLEVLKDGVDSFGEVVKDLTSFSKDTSDLEYSIKETYEKFEGYVLALKEAEDKQDVEGVLSLIMDTGVKFYGWDMMGHHQVISKWLEEIEEAFENLVDVVYDVEEIVDGWG